MKIPLLDKLFKRGGWSAGDERWWHDIGFSGTSATGMQVTEANALQSAAVFACVRVLSETVASLPLPVYRRLTPRGKERAPEYPLYSILHDAPNPEMTSFTFRETLMGHLATWGNAYGYIDFEKNGRVSGLLPLLPGRMNVKRTNGQLYYHYRMNDGTEYVWPSYRVLHIPGLGYDGIIGYSVIHMAREAIGLTMAEEQFGSSYFGNGAQPGGVLEHPSKLSVDAQTNLRKSWNEMHQGLSNQHRIAILEEGMKYKQTSIPPEDSQFLEARHFQVEEIARIYRIPQHMIGELGHATFSNVEHLSIDFVVHTMRPWLVRWEQTINQKLISSMDGKTYFAEFLVDGLLRGDSVARASYYKEMFFMGAMSPNDIREKENMNPVEGGDSYYIPMNMLPAGAPVPEKKSLRETRDVKKGLQRYRISKSYLPVFSDAVQRIVDRETNNLLRAAKKHLTVRSIADWETWLKDFYRDFPEFMTRQMAPAVHSLAEAMQAAAAGEVAADVGMTPELDSFLKDYLNTFNYRYLKSSQGQLEALIRDAGEGETLDIVETRLGEWEDKRADKSAMNETVQLGNAVAKFVFAGAGVTRLMWQNTSGKSCPFCEEMDGRIVGIQQNFLSSGETLAAEGEGQDMKVYRPCSQPPLHLACSCVILPA